jgi:hypothetical protein
MEENDFHRISGINMVDHERRGNNLNPSGLRAKYRHLTEEQFFKKFHCTD